MEETDGIVNKLQESDRNISILIEYMDWKNYPSEENLNFLYERYKYKYHDVKIDIVITTDDKALEFALEKRKELFSDAPIVFCGVNQEGAETITKGYDRVTGAMEVIDPTQTIVMAYQINPDIKNIYLLFDNSESGQSTGNIVTDKIESMKTYFNIIPCNNLTYEKLIDLVKLLKNDSIILTTTYYSDVNNNIYNMDFVTREMSAVSHVPVYDIYDFGLDNGALGGAMLSGKLQGENAASLAIRLLKGERIDNIPIISPQSTRTVFDYNQLKRFNIPLRKLPKDCEIINKPFSFFETYKILVISVSIVFLVLIIFVCILHLDLRKIKRMKKNLSESHEELTQIYEELAASDEELKEQYDKIVAINEQIKIGDEKITYLAYHDPLTGLKNKLSLYENSKDIFCNERCKSALLFIDIDNFKYVNDTMGHAFGDRLIVKVSERLTSILTENCYRLSGDEFIIILEGIEKRKEAEDFASRIISLFSDEIEIQNIVMHISLSIGIAMYPDHGSHIDQLLKYADIAMYRVKENGRKNFMMYDQLMNEIFTERVNIEKYLMKALDNNEFEIYYQPQLNLKTSKITGFEALLRWRSPELGNVSPLKFIKVAEDTHIIIPLGTWVLKNACEFLRRLNNKGFEDLTVSVNISILQLLQTDFCDMVMDTLEELHIEPENLELEITESILMESFENIEASLQKLSKHKVRIALDDFGKGYSSLNYLKILPIDTLKVDKSFIDDITEKSSETLTGHIVTIGKSMGLCIVAEGVEHQIQKDYLIQHECDKMQGYLYSKPVPEARLLEMLEKEQS
jgi:diguanylate cyclase (GGDEF)-like protein